MSGTKALGGAEGRSRSWQTRGDTQHSQLLGTRRICKHLTPSKRCLSSASSQGVLICTSERQFAKLRLKPPPIALIKAATHELTQPEHDSRAYTRQRGEIPRCSLFVLVLRKILAANRRYEQSLSTAGRSPHLHCHSPGYGVSAHGAPLRHPRRELLPRVTDCTR